MASNAMTTGTITSDSIESAHKKIKEIVTKYNEVNKRVSEITNEVKDNWVGKGLNEFESQYNMLIKKIDDFGDVLSDIYDALVEAQGEYDTADDSMRQQFAMAQSDLKV